MIALSPVFTQIRGAKRLVVDAIDEGARAVERVHLSVAGRSFTAAAAFAGDPAREVQRLHDAFVSGTYGQVRDVTRLTSSLLDVALDVVERRAGGEPAASPEPSPATPASAGK